jgi:DNA repair exonuclease SbcCD ATPase subunit
MDEYTLPDLFRDADDKEEELRYAKAELECAKRALANIKADHEKKLSELVNELERIKQEKMERVSTLRKEHIAELEKVKDFYLQQKKIDEQMSDILSREVSISEIKQEQDEIMMEKIKDNFSKKMEKLKEEKEEIEKKLLETDKELEIRKKIESNKKVINSIKEKKHLSSFERLSRGESSVVKPSMKKPILKRSLTRSNVSV